MAEDLYGRGGKYDRFGFDSSWWDQHVKAPVSQFSYQNNPEAYDVQSTSDWYNPGSWGDQTETLKPGYSADGTFSQSAANIQIKNDNLQAKSALDRARADNLGTSYSDMANIGLGAAGLGMQMGMYKDQKDYLKSSLTALKDNTRNANEAHRYQIDTKKSYGSMFSNA